jgi:putative hydrolase of the HAD superfamily
MLAAWCVECAGVEGRRFAGLIMDFAGVLTANMVEVIGSFEAREGLPPGSFLRVWADSRGQELYRRLELGQISQTGWNEGFGELLGIDSTNLMGRLLADLSPAYDMLRVVRQARAAGIRTAVLSNSLGRQPHDPYARYHLAGSFDVVVLSDDHGIRKPDPAIFRLTVDRLGVPAESCVFADDTEENLLSAYRMGMTVIHAVDEDDTAPHLRHLLGLPDPYSVPVVQERPDGR